jgi:predicted GH43/DUF377 family glycosyl hydrolase
MISHLICLWISLSIVPTFAPRAMAQASNQPENRWGDLPAVKPVAPEYPSFVSGPFVKKQKPIFSPSKMFDATFNPTAFVAKDTDGRDKVFMVLRGEKNIPDPRWKRRSLPYLAVSEDGVHFKLVSDQPMFLPEEDFNKLGGIEDPKYVNLKQQPFIDTDGKSFDGAILYVGYDGKTARIGVAYFNHNDLTYFRKAKNPIFPDADVLKNPIVPNSAWNKSPSTLQYPDPHTGKIRNVMFAGEGSLEHGGIHVMESDKPFGWHWPKPGISPLIKARLGKYDQNLVESAFAPVIAPLPKDLALQEGISHGIYLCLHGDSRPMGYQVGYRIVSMEDPTRLLYESSGPFLSPTLPWEINGQVGKVLFASGSVEFQNKRRIYYGGADSNIGVATAPASVHVAIKILDRATGIWNSGKILPQSKNN